MQHETIHPSNLTPQDRAAWLDLCAADPAYGSPLLGPDFAVRVGRFRADALVTIWRSIDADGRRQPVAFLPHHRRLGGLACPIGAPLSDYHGPVAVRGFDLAAALEIAGLSAYRFSSLPLPAWAPPAAAKTAADGFLIDLQESPEAYLEALREQRPKSFKNYRRLAHKIERELGPLHLTACTDRQVFIRLLDWKQAQLARTAAFDFLAPAWLQAMLHDLFDDSRQEDGGLMLALYAGDRLLGGHFGLRPGEVYHPWIASTDPTLAEWAPGHLFLLQVIRAMPELGLRVYDLGPSHDHYKRPYARSVRPVVEGVCFARSAEVQDAPETAWRLTSAERPGLAGRIRRRIDMVSMSEPSWMGRVQAYARSASAATRRAGGSGEPPA